MACTNMTPDIAAAIREEVERYMKCKFDCYIKEFQKKSDERFERIEEHLKELQNSINVLRSEKKEKMENCVVGSNFMHEYEGIRLSELAIRKIPAIQALYEYFPSGMCYYAYNYAGVKSKGVLKRLIYPKVKNNYITRIPEWTPEKVDEPFDIKIGGKTFTITEYHVLNYDELTDIYYIVPEIFGDFHQLTGYGFFQKYGHEVEISECSITIRGYSWGLHDCFQ